MIRICKKFYALLNAHQRNRVVILLFMMIIGAVFEVFSVSMMLPLVSTIMNENIIYENVYISKLCGFFHITTHMDFIMFCIIVIMGLYILKTAYLLFQYYIQFRFIGYNQFATQEKLLASYMRRPYSFFLGAESGEIIRIVQTDTANTFNMLAVLLSAVSETIVAIALVITIFLISPLMSSFVAAILTILMILIVKIVRPILKKQGMILQESYAETNKWLLQAITGIKEIKVSQTERFFQDNFREYGLKMVYAMRINSTFQSMPRLLIELVSVCAMFVVMGLMLASGQSVNSLVPALSAFVMAAIKLLPSANRIVGAVNQIVFFEPALDNMLANIKDAEAKGIALLTNHVDACLDREKIGLARDIYMKNISFSYPNSEIKILENAELVIPVGSSVGIIGVSGSGKTTAVDILLGLLTPQEGQVFADGVDVSTNMSGWLQHIGYIPQMIFMLDDTIRANVEFGKASDEANVWRALEEAHLADFVKGLPDGLDTKIGERGIRLSGGQRQRIGIARALYHDPDVLVFDEATSALDNDTEASIMESINSLHGKKTLIIIAHRLSTIEECDIVYRVGEGTIRKELL